MEIKRFKPTNHFIKALIYGGPGKGKTRFGGTAYGTMDDPKMIIASAEAGLLTYAEMGINPPYVQITTLKDLQELYEYLRDEKHSYETVLIDSITEINDIIKTQKEKSIGKPLQIQHWGEISKAIEGILRDFRNLNMNVIFIAQEKEIIDDNKIARVVPMLNGQTATKISYFMDIVGHAELDEKGDYVINLHTDARYDNKTRLSSLRGIVEPDFKKWQKAIAGLETCEVEDCLYKTLTKEELAEKLIEEQNQHFADFFETIKSSETLKELQENYTSFATASKQKDYFRKEHVDELLELKENMKNGFMEKIEKEKEKPKFVAKVNIDNETLEKGSEETEKMIAKQKQVEQK